MIFFISFWTNATVAAKNAVIIPTTATTLSANWEYSKIGEHLTTKKTPAVTMVAAWINADTGVGPSMASGGHVCNKNCADFPIAPAKRRRQITVIKLNWMPKKIISFCANNGVCWKTSL